MSKQTILGEAQITHSPHNVIEIRLIESDDLPPFVEIGWPLQPSVLDPKAFRDVAATVVKLFSEAHITLARIKARRL
jgi:hypothetical protein